MPAEPVPEIGSVVRFCVPKAVRSISEIWSMMARKRGSRWPRVGLARAARISGGVSDGPGPSRVTRGGSTGAGMVNASLLAAGALILNWGGRADNPGDQASLRRLLGLAAVAIALASASIRSS
jgi:hypothetical protein